MDPLDQWFSTFFGQRPTFHQKFSCGTPKTRKILKITSKNFYFCTKLLGFENCHTFSTNHYTQHYMYFSFFETKMITYKLVKVS